MDYEQITLAHAVQHFERLVEIVDEVRLKQGLTPINAMAALQSFAKRGDTAALAWDDGRLMGLTCLGLCHHFIAGTEWLPIKLHLARSGIPLSTLGCSHFVYLDPAHWGAGHTASLTEAARRSNPAITHTLSHSFATPELENWAAKLPGIQELDVPGPNGGRVFVREVG
jgi:hypothetical protein